MSFFNKLRNIIRQEAQMATAHVSLPRAGIVTNYDPVHYTARVKIQPEGIWTGYLPIVSEWVGPGWGDYSPPIIGQVVSVHFQQGGKEAAFISGYFFSNNTQPLPCPSGERWLVHSTGSSIRLTNDGGVTINSNTNMTLNAPNGTFRVAAKNIQMHADEIYRFDCDGHGQAWTPNAIDTYQIGEVPGTTNNISPPEIGD